MVVYRITVKRWAIRQHSNIQDIFEKEKKGYN